MLTQILLTALVLVGALLFTRLRGTAPRNSRQSQPAGRATTRSAGRGSRSVVGYALLGLLVVGALVVFYLQWQHAHQVMTVRVVDGGSGEATVYHVYRKDLGGREFQTLDGRQVSLGVGDRMELSER